MFNGVEASERGCKDCVAKINNNTLACLMR